MSQMGTLISLDCLLYQMKAERTVDIYGVTLQLARSCCLMTPTLVGGKKGWWAGWSRGFLLTCLELAASCPLLGAPCCLGVQPQQGFPSCFLPSLWLCQPPRAEGTDFSQARVFHLLSSGVKIS